MKAKYLAKLENKIQEFINDICEEYSNEYDGYYPDNIVEQMAIAAAIVLDMAFESQKFADEARGEYER